jgi:hypothetical protein
MTLFITNIVQLNPELHVMSVQFHGYAEFLPVVWRCAPPPTLRLEECMLKTPPLNAML